MSDQRPPQAIAAQIVRQCAYCGGALRLHHLCANKDCIQRLRDDVFAVSQEPEHQDCVAALIAKWRESAERHKTHGDSYRIGQGWALDECADELESKWEAIASALSAQQNELIRASEQPALSEGQDLRAHNDKAPHETARQKNRRERRGVALFSLDHLLTVAMKPYKGDRASEEDLMSAYRKVSLLISEFESEANATERVCDCEGTMAAPTAWMPIETAPKDGTPVWLVEDGRPLGLLIAHQYVGYWQPKKGYQAGGCWQQVDLSVVGSPTHWMPLPAPPEAV